MIKTKEDQGMGNGLKFKYMLRKANGDPVDPNGMYFVLKLNSEKKDHAEASQEAALRYAEKIESTMPDLSRELISSVEALRRDSDLNVWDARVIRSTGHHDAQLEEYKEKYERLKSACEFVVATSHGNSYGLTTEEVLAAQLLAAKEVEEALGREEVERILTWSAS